MDFKTFKKKITSRILWCNILAMVIVVIVLLVCVKCGLDNYTHHGEEIVVPDVTNKSSEHARRLLNEAGLSVAVADTGYIKDIPADFILEQKPEAGAKVKASHIINLTVNATRTPTLTMPDIVQNCSLREATAKLKSMGFKLGATQLISGEKDWVYGVLVDGKHVTAGEKVPINKTVVIQAGSGYDDYSADSLAVDENFVDDFEPII